MTTSASRRHACGFRHRECVHVRRRPVFTVPLSGLAKSRRVRVSLPKITALLDDPRYAASAEPTTPPTLSAEREHPETEGR